MVHIYKAWETFRRGEEYRGEVVYILVRAGNIWDGWGLLFILLFSHSFTYYLFIYLFIFIRIK